MIQSPRESPIPFLPKNPRGHFGLSSAQLTLRKPLICFEFQCDSLNFDVDINYSYRKFHEARDPRLPLEVMEYAEMVLNLNRFMNKMLETLKQDEDLVGKAKPFRRWKMLAFLVLLLASGAGVVFLEHPGWISFSAFCGIVMGVAFLAVPITHWQDLSIYRRRVNVFVQEVKSYYMFQYSVIRKSGNYEDYTQHLDEADTDVFLLYMQKYAS